MNKFVIFTDLDGTLLNHDDYSFDEAKDMISFLNKNKIPIIFTTSKTKKECEALQKKMSIADPFIVENGAAIFFPKQDDSYKIIKLGLTHKEIKKFIDRVKDKFEILNFSNMSITQIIKYTNLSYDEAKMASQREYSEPFLIKDEKKLDKLEILANKYGLKIIKGGRFYHLLSINQDKANALLYLMNYYKDKVSIALGDSYNDINMLKVANIAILIPQNSDKFIDSNLPNLIKAPCKGAKGWSESLKKVLKQYE